jgi:hypothetical protein
MRLLRVLLTTLACLLSCASICRAASDRSASGFYNSVGVDTHLTFANTTYGDWPRLVGLLGQLGVRHLSDGAYGNPASSWAGFNQLFDSRVQLAVAHGMRFAYEMGKPGYQGGSIAQLVSVMSGPLRSSIEAVEDPNEFDSSGLTDWAPALASYDRQLFAAVKASPQLRSLPVIGPSLVNEDSPSQLGDQQSSLDAGDIHPYTGGLAPTPAYIQSQLQRIRAVSGDKPVWATELGYSTALNAPAGQQPVSEYTDAVYLLRELLENFQAGVQRSYVYELIDDLADPSDSNVQDHYGLLRANYTPKPAFTALQNLLALVGDQAPATLTPLQLSITQAPDDLQQIVLQQSAHSYLVVLWRLASVWNVNDRKPIAVADSPLTLQIPNATSASSADPLNTQTLTAMTLDHGQLHTTIGADPITIHITTAANGTESPSAGGSASSHRRSSNSSTAHSAKARRGAVCRAHGRVSQPTLDRTRPVARWIATELTRLRCTNERPAAEISLYATATEPGGHSGHAAQNPIAHRRLTPRSAPAIVSWIVHRSRTELRHGDRLIVRLLAAQRKSTQSR